LRAIVAAQSSISPAAAAPDLSVIIASVAFVWGALKELNGLTLLWAVSVISSL
jgi:hypothetical protein